MSLIDKIFGKTNKTNPEHELRIVEGFEGRWFYHLAHGDKTQALCNPDIRVMYSPSVLANWGYVGDLNERYCAECERIARESNLPNVDKLGKPNAK